VKKPYTVSKAGMEKDPTAAQMVEEHYQNYVENGYRILDNWDHRKGAPFTRKMPGGYWQTEDHGFLDHLYRIKRPDGSTIYVSEPYHLHPSEFPVLMEEEKQGWKISIDGHCLWFPGWTVRIMFSREELQV
jgi:hypothetical protein